MVALFVRCTVGLQFDCVLDIYDVHNPHQVKGHRGYDLLGQEDPLGLPAQQAPLLQPLP